MFNSINDFLNNIFAFEKLSTGDLVIIGTTLLLATLAILAPRLLEKWKKRYYSPDLSIHYFHESPYYHQTHLDKGELNIPAHYFRFMVKNSGKSQAEECVAVLDTIWEVDESGNLSKDNKFSPTPLKWVGTMETSITIQPERNVYCDIGHVYHPNHEEKSVYYSDQQNFGKYSGFGGTIATSYSLGSAPSSLFESNFEGYSKFFFEFDKKYHAYRDCLKPGKYQLEISVYCNNSKKASKKFEISWSGNWKDAEVEMLNEMVIS